ncbi:MAG TPA: methyltransferase domain-containing protein [Burkholderiales bacterium]|nr:methyltransferase domain-containing protein [Burkholderiales bacterium]
MRRKASQWIRAAVAALLVAGAAHAQTEPERTGGPYVPTPQIVVDQMLRLANVGADDYLMDLGSGDGVIVLTAAQQYRARGMGVDIDPELVKQANQEAARLGIADRASFKVMDVFKADLSRASVVTLYLLPGMMINLRPKIYLELKPGTRVVSHDYHFDDWRPDDAVTFDVPEKEKINGVPRATVYLWIIPARIGGRWTVTVEGGEKYDLTWRQSYQAIDGRAQSAGRAVKVQDSTLRGEQLEFTLAPQGARQSFKGRVNGDAMQGTVDLGRGKTARWTAVRAGTRDRQASIK